MRVRNFPRAVVFRLCDSLNFPSPSMGEDEGGGGKGLNEDDLKIVGPFIS